MNKTIRVGLAKTKTPRPNGADLASVKVKRKEGTESFHKDGTALNINLKDFWQWSASDLMSNASRCLLARYLVANALELGADVRDQRAPFDLETKEGIKIEVQSFSPFQSSCQERSNHSLGISPTNSGNEAISKFDKETEPQADVYVLCVLGDRETDEDKVDPLNINHWDFYILQAPVLNEKRPTLTSSEAGLNNLSLMPVEYAELGARVRDLSPRHGTQRILGSPNQRCVASLAR